MSYINWYSTSDKTLGEVIGSFIKHHRLDQNKTQGQLAEQAGISRSTLSLLERGETVTVPTLLQVLRVLELLYIMDSFQITSQPSPLELAKLDRKKRQRARPNKQEDKPDSQW